MFVQKDIIVADAPPDVALAILAGGYVGRCCGSSIRRNCNHWGRRTNQTQGTGHFTWWCQCCLHATTGDSKLLPGEFMCDGTRV